MNRKITFRSMEHSDTLEKDINTHIDKMEKYFKQEQEPIDIDVTLESHRDEQFFIIEFKIQAPHYHIIAKEEGQSIPLLINNVTRKAIQEIIKKKGKDQTKRDSNHSKD